MGRRRGDTYVSTLGIGLVDGPDATDIPDGAFYDSKGFNYDRGYPRSENGRATINTTEFVTGATVDAITYWSEPDGTKRLWVMTDGILGETSGNSFTVKSRLSDLVNAGTLTGSTVTPSSTARLVGTLQVGDLFYFDGDSFADRATITSITAATFNVNSYGGASNSGAYWLVRRLGGSTVSLVPAGGRLFITDGTNRMHWYGDDGDGNTIFRETGLAPPSAAPAITLGAGGGLRCQTATATTGQKATINSFSDAPSWATRMQVYRTLVNGDVTFSIAPTVSGLKSASKATSSGDSVFTLNAAVPSLTADQHIHRYVTFAATGNEYRITDNATNTVTLAGSAAFSDESATDIITISGGFDWTNADSSGIVDLTPDSALDLDHESPTDNTQPIAGLTQLHLFRGGGRLVALDPKEDTKAWFSGRPDTAAIKIGDAANGEGELDYWSIYHMVGDQDSDRVKTFASIGPKTFALKEDSVWEVLQEDLSNDNWFWFPVQAAIGTGCLSARSVIGARGMLYWFGHEGNGVDVIRFDGFEARGLLRSWNRTVGGPISRATLDSIISYDNVTAGMFQGRILMAYTVTGGSQNSRVLDWDVKHRNLALQPWGLGVFSNSYDDSGTGKVVAATPTGSVSKIVEVFSGADDLGTGIARQLITKQFYAPQPTKHRSLKIRVVNGNTLGTAPTVNYSVDGLPPDAAGKTWKSTLTGDTWDTAVGEQDLTYEIQDGERSHAICYRITSTDAKDWGIKRLRLEGTPYEQKSLGAT
jgi:hypothetical protein